MRKLEARENSNALIFKAELVQRSKESSESLYNTLNGSNQGWAGGIPPSGWKLLDTDRTGSAAWRSPTGKVQHPLS
jgi:hypothetical protein